MSKTEMIEMIKSLPDDIDVFMNMGKTYGELDFRVFITPRDKEFYSYYFGL